MFSSLRLQVITNQGIHITNQEIVELVNPAAGPLLNYLYHLIAKQ